MSRSSSPLDTPGQFPADSPRPPLWNDRAAAGRELAAQLQGWHGDHQALVIGLPRGGVAVAAVLADALELPLSTWAVRKLAHPAEPEVAVGALAPGGVLLWDEPYLQQQHLPLELRRQLVQEQDQELQRRQRLFADPPAAALRGRHLLVVDDGVATGLTARAALTSLRRCVPSRLVLAVPVIDQEVARRLESSLEGLVDGLVALARVERLTAVGAWYRHFEQLDDASVAALLRDRRPGSPVRPG